MLVYNVTVNIDPDVEEEWKVWMKDVHIPEVLATNRFNGSKFLKLLTESPEATGATYAIQYFAATIDDVEQYLNHDAAALQKDHTDKFGSKFVAFRTLLEEVS
ncbi:MAG: DUF4286 family protein [Bacteroidota bacterium]